MRGKPGDRPLPAADLARLADRTRQVLLEMIHLAGSGHAGSSLSCVDLLTVLRFDRMRWRADVPGADRDVLVLSKGHAAPAWYATLIVAGDLDSAQVKTLRTLDSPLQGHPDRGRLDLVDVSTGALGQGLSVALGRAEGKRLKGQDLDVYCLVGDGECQEGQVWEALMYAGVRRLGNVVLLVDCNGSQNDGAVQDVLSLEPLREKLEAFRWHVQEVDGHAHDEIRRAAARATAHRSQPSAILARTHKGRLGPGRLVLAGAHTGTLTAEDLHQATAYLEGRA